jgi:hypothetical protein
MSKNLLDIIPDTHTITTGIAEIWNLKGKVLPRIGHEGPKGE